MTEETEQLTDLSHVQQSLMRHLQDPGENAKCLLQEESTPAAQKSKH